MSSGTIELHGDALAGLEFVLGADDALLVNGKRASASVADSVLDMCGVIVSLTLAPIDGASVAELEGWLGALRAEALAREQP
jgi:hypothetical protein